jgi:hypothetical protein
MNIYKAWRTVKEEMDNLIIVNEEEKNIPTLAKTKLAYKVKNDIEFKQKNIKDYF